MDKYYGTLEFLKEPINGIIRVGPSHFSWENEDPYTTAVTISGTMDQVRIKGLDKTITLREARAIREVLNIHHLKCQFHDLLTTKEEVND